MRLLAILLLSAVSAWAQYCPPSLIDDFRTSQPQPLAQLGAVGNAQFNKVFAEPTAPGGFRRYFFTSADNRFAQTAQLSIVNDAKDGKSTLVVSAGIRQAVVLEIDYGVDDHGAIPLHLKPQSGCDRIRLTFDSNSQQLDVFSQIDVPGVVGTLSSEAIVPSAGHPFCVDFFLAKFLPHQPTPPDLGRTGIDGLHLVLHPAGEIGAHDYAIKQMEFAGASTNSGVGACIVAP